jgi:hypothetical protein
LIEEAQDMRLKSRVGLLFVALLACCGQTNSVKNPLAGTWTVSEIVFKGPDGEKRIADPQPGLLIFSDQHYSFVWTPTDEARTPFQSFTEPTLEEIQAAFNSIIVNAGEYEVTGSTITTRPVVSRIPGFTGGYAVYDFQLEERTLTLTMTDEYDRNGTQATWAKKGRSTAFRLVREE